MKINIPILAAAVCFVSCKQTVEPEKLYGKWDYIKVENPVVSPPDTTSAEELKSASPSIVFSPGKLTINWGGRVLSHGTFKVEGTMLRYHELLDNGKVNDFPFLVSKLTDREIIFETMRREDPVRVTAVKVK